MEKLVVLDHSNSSVHFYNVDSEANIDEEYIESIGHHASNCSWMFAEDLDIFHHKGILK